MLSYFLFPIALMLLFYALKIFFYPEYKIEVHKKYVTETKPLPREINQWDKEIICARGAPTPLFLNFYGNSKEPWIAILFGREKEVARTFIIPKRPGGEFLVRYEADKDYLKNFEFTKDEENFLHLCVYNAFMPKTAL